MLRFSANLSFLFQELPLRERFAAAAAAGFQGVEYMSPYDEDANVLRSLLRGHGLSQVLFNLPSGDWTRGERGLACLPARVAEFRQGVATALRYAAVLDCPRLNCLAGIASPDVEPERARATLIDNLRFAASACEAAGVTLLLEPINRFDMPGYLVQRTVDALAIIDAVGSPHLRLQYDVYHAQRTEGELAATLRAHVGRIGHIQIADNPGRHEPGSGEINYAWLLRHIDALGYEGWVGCEYHPRTTTVAGLGWMRNVAP